MPYKEKQIEKIFYSIGEVAEMLKVSTSHIRFWSKQFDVIKPATNKKGNRQFTTNDIENFKMIFHLVKEKGFTLKGARVEMKQMRKKMRIEQNPSSARPEITADTKDDVSQAVQSFSKTELTAGEYIDNLSIIKSLEKIKVSLLDIQKNLDNLTA